MESKIIYACFEHVEIAIDDFVNNMEEAPEITESNKGKCCYCNEKSEYEIKK